MIKTFTGYSTGGLDEAVKSAEQDYVEYYEVLRAPIKPQHVTTTSSIRGADVEGGVEYWFTMTVLFGPQS